MKVKFLHSIRFDVFTKMTLLILIFMVVGTGFSLFFMDDYYESMKMDSLYESAAELKNIYYEDKSAFYSAAETVSEQLGALYLIYDYQSDTSVSNPLYETGRGNGRYSGMAGAAQRSEQTIANIFELQAHDLDAVVEDGFELVRDYNDQLNSEFYSMAFVLDDTYLMVMNVPLAVIDDSVKVARNFFLVLSGILFLIGSVFSFFISRSITSPIIRLNEAVGDMANMKFDTYYREERQDEIGMLGKSFNQLSTRLSHTLSQLNGANEQLKEDLSVIERSEKLREEFVASASHELKTPVAVIQGYAQGLRDIDDGNKRDHYVDVIVRESEKMDQMIRDLLNLSELESHYTQLDMTRFDLVELVEEEVMSLRQRMDERGIRLRFDPPAAVEVEADRAKLSQVVRNYLSNAIHHTGEGRGIRVDLFRLNDKVQLRIENDGAPIPEEKLSEIWSAFYKVDRARSRAYGGTGLGLSIVRRICELHGFDYGAENTENGVAFWVNVT